jgi:hypothetical protein
MMKSYQESGGTTLSTNWDEVKKGKVEVKPPAGSGSLVKMPCMIEFLLSLCRVEKIWLIGSPRVLGVWRLVFSFRRSIKRVYEEKVSHCGANIFCEDVLLTAQPWPVNSRDQI